MAQNMGIPYFINALEEEEDDFDELAPECRPMEQFPQRVPLVFRDRTNPMEEHNEEEFGIRFRVTKRAVIGE